MSLTQCFAINFLFPTCFHFKDFLFSKWANFSFHDFYFFFVYFNGYRLNNFFPAPTNFELFLIFYCKMQWRKKQVLIKKVVCKKIGFRNMMNWGRTLKTLIGNQLIRPLVPSNGRWINILLFKLFVRLRRSLMLSPRELLELRTWKEFN